MTTMMMKIIIQKINPFLNRVLGLNVLKIKNVAIVDIQWSITITIKIINYKIRKCVYLKVITQLKLMGVKLIKMFRSRNASKMLMIIVVLLSVRLIQGLKHVDQVDAQTMNKCNGNVQNVRTTNVLKIKNASKKGDKKNCAWAWTIVHLEKELKPLKLCVPELPVNAVPQLSKRKIFVQPKTSFSTETSSSN